MTSPPEAPAAGSAGPAERAAPRRRGAVRHSAGLVDQIVSGLSNVLAVVLVARASSADDFGRFSLGYATLTVVLTLTRSSLGTRISLVRGSAAARDLTQQLLAAVLMASPVVVLVVLAAGIGVTGTGGLDVLLVVALACPTVLAQDLLRFGAVATGHPAHALVSDVVWLVALALPVLLRVDLTAGQALLVWQGGALAALCVAAGATGLRPVVAGSLSALRRRDSVGEAVAVGTLVTAAASLTVLFVVGRVVGPSAAGSLRGASTAMGPVNVLLAFVTLGLVPALVRRPRAGDLLACGAACGALVAAVLVWGGALLVLPTSWGTAAFGSSWDGVRGVLPWTVLEYVALGTASAATLGLKVRQRGRDLVVQRVASAGVALLAGTTWAIAAREPRGVAAMLALAAGVLAALAWLQLLRSIRSGSREVAA